MKHPNLLLLAFLTTLFSQSILAKEILDLSKQDKDKLFHFYLGEWQYETANKMAHGRAVVESHINGTVIRDTTFGHFNSIEFLGNALFTYDSEKDVWRQQWTDSLGNALNVVIQLAPYERATGMALVGEFEHQGTKMQHVWYNITDERFETDLVIVSENGNIQLIRQMPYVRITKD